MSNHQYFYYDSEQIETLDDRISDLEDQIKDLEKKINELEERFMLNK